MTEFDIEYTSLPTCPHCGWKDRDWWDYAPVGLQYDGDMSERWCGSCEEPYTVTLSLSHDFSTVQGHKDKN